MAFLDATGLAHLWEKITAKLGNKVDKVSGKGLSTNDYTTDEKNKLAGIASGANKTTVDSALSSTSTNPVQNKVVNTAISGLKTLVGDTSVSSQISSAISAQKGKASGLAELDSTGKVPSAQLPSYVDDVIDGYLSNGKFYTTKGSDGTYSGEITGESGKIYIDLNTSKTYRWSGSAYAVISETIALGTTSSTAFRGDQGKVAYDHATAKGSAFASGLYKITTNDQGHVTAATAVTKSDITALGIPAQDTNTTYSDMKGATSDADGVHGLVPAPTKGKQGQYLRGDGTWATPANTTYSAATVSAPGLMSAADKQKLDGIASGATKVTVDSALSSTSANPVQNKAVNTAITNLNTLVGDKSVSTQITTGTNPFIKGLSVSGTTITYTKGDGTTGTITTQDTNTTYSDMKGATGSAAGTHGLVPAPAAGKQTSFLRGDGTWVVPTNTTYSNATTSSPGLMSAADKTKLDGLVAITNDEIDKIIT